MPCNLGIEIVLILIFFEKEDFDTVRLFEKIQNIFSGHAILKIQEEINSLTVLIDENIKLSFFSYKYELLEDLKKNDFFSFASVLDIACMKLTAILSRATNKDYIDLFYIFKEYKLNDVLEMFGRKYKNIDLNLVLKSLVFFDDIEYEPIIFKNNSDIGFDELKAFLVKLVKEK